MPLSISQLFYSIKSILPCKWSLNLWVQYSWLFSPSIQASSLQIFFRSQLTSRQSMIWSLFCAGLQLNLVSISFWELHWISSQRANPLKSCHEKQTAIVTPQLCPTWTMRSPLSEISSRSWPGYVLTALLPAPWPDILGSHYCFGDRRNTWMMSCLVRRNPCLSKSVIACLVT